MKKTVFPIIILSLIIVASVVGYKVWASSIPYSILKIKKAIANHDRYLFEKHVDLEAFLSRAVNDFMSFSMASADIGEQDGLGNAFAMGMMQMIKPALISAGKESIYRYIETGNFKEESKPNAEPVEPGQPEQSFENKISELTSSVSFSGKASIKRDKSTAIWSAEIKDTRFDKSSNLDFRLIQTPEKYWRVTEISNLNEYLAESQALELNWKIEKNQPVKQSMLKLCEVVGTKKSSTNEGFEQNIVYSVTFKNIGLRKIKKITGKIIAKNGNYEDSLVAQVDADIASQATGTYFWKKSPNMFNANEMAILNSPDNEVAVTFEITSITLDDGEKIELPFII